MDDQPAALVRALTEYPPPREDIEGAVPAAMTREDREAYVRVPERPDPFWWSIEVWPDDHPG